MISPPFKLPLVLLATALAVCLTASPAPAQQGLPEDGVAQMETVREIRAVGGAAMAWIDDQAIRRGASGESEGGTEKKPPRDWGNCPAITHAELELLLVPEYLSELQATDGWGAPFQYCLARENVSTREFLAGVRSAGSDGLFSASSYEPGGFPAHRTTEDIVWLEGYFLRWPTAASQP